MNLLLSQLKTLAIIWLTLCIAPLILYLLPPAWHPIPLDAYFFITLVLLLGLIAAIMTLILHNLTTSHLQQALLLAGHRPNASILILDHRYRILHADQTFSVQVWGRGDWLYLCPIRRFLRDTEFAELTERKHRQQHWQGRVALLDGHEQEHLFQAQLSTLQGLLPWRPYYLLWLTPQTNEPNHTRPQEHNNDYDPVTGLISANKFNQLLYLQTRLHHRYHPSPPDCFALCNVDAFRALNERHGHAIGDQILVELARRLKVSLRDTDLLARTDGDEFSIIILHVSIEQACALLERIGQDIAASSQQLFTVSIGVCEISADQAKTVQHARTALARAQNKGRNCVSAYNYNHFKLVGKSD